MRFRALLAVAAASAAFVGATATANADAIVWTFNNPPGDNGVSATYASNPVLSPAESIVATAYGPQLNGKAAHLFGKNGGTGEVGLGLTNDPSGDNEISTGSFVQLDLSALHAPPLNSLTFSFEAGSATGDQWAVYGSNTVGGYSTINLIDTGTNNNLISSLPGTILGTYTYLDVTALQGNILLNEIDNTFTTVIGNQNVPEPSSMALLGVGLAGIGLFRRLSKGRSA